MSIYTVTNPATGEVVREYPTATDDQVADAIGAVDSAFAAWRTSAPEARAAYLGRVADLFADRRSELAAIITREMGKPIVQAGFEVDITVSILRYYAEQGPGFLADEEIPVAAGGTAVVRREGLGPLLGIMPWNFPYYQVARFAAPNLMNGNTILLKHAPQCPESAAAMQEIFDAARGDDVPAGVYVNVYATNEQVSDVITDPRVRGVSLTGSERAGSAVAEQAGRHLKKVVLELGGSDPFLLLDSEDLDTTIKAAVLGRLVNTGQACNAAKRFIVADELYDEFVEKFAAALGGIEPSDPTEEGCFVGPLSSAAAADTLDAQVREALAEGATAVVGGERVAEGSNFYRPTLLTGVTPEMATYRRELFGPVAMVFRASDEDEMVRLANDTPYGLGASIHTSDEERAVRLGARLDVGMVYVNEPGGTAAELPFGGVKNSGFGRELGRYGMDEFVNLKLVRVAAGK
ncbi:NAD-dependent succinate-semialdehyde dehydrogenase [Corynebacterium sp. 335C]